MSRVVYDVTSKLGTIEWKCRSFSTRKVAAVRVMFYALAAHRWLSVVGRVVAQKKGHMRRTFPLQDLSNDEFEDLVAGICQRILGTGTIVFATGKDGGRDAAFKGTAQKFPSVETPLAGKFIIQAKHTANPVASCSDAEFGRILDGEKPKIVVLIAAGELEHYLCFTNRKKPADDAIAKERALKALGLQNAHLLGIEQIRAWLTHHLEVWKNLGFDRFETPFRIQTADLTAVITAFHDVLNAEVDEPAFGTFSYVAKPQKNKINKLSDAYFRRNSYALSPVLQGDRRFS